jgi:hypothetical protein
MRRARPVLLSAPLYVAIVALLVGCVGEPDPVATPLSAVEACDALQDAVGEFYEVAQPGSTVEELPNYDLPTIKDFVIPKPTCAFQVRPDPDVIPGDVFTIEAFYLDYDEEMTVTLPQKLEAAGFQQRDPNFDTWAATKLGRAYSAAMLLFAPGDGQPYSEAAEHFRLLDLSIGQN